MSENTSLDEALAAGFGGNEGGEPDGGAVPEGAGAQAEPLAQAAPPEAEQQGEEAAAEEPSDGRPRDASGKFAPKGQQPAPAAPKGAEAAKKAPVPTTKPEAPAAPAAPELKPPQHWKAAAREEWAKLPRPVQEEAKRIEGETNRVMRESAQARQFATNFEKVLLPYRALVSGEPLQVVGNLLQTAATLQTAPAPQKAQLVAEIIKTYGVDVATLDAILSGQQPEGGKQPAQPPRAEQIRDPRVDAWLAQQEQERMLSTQRTVQEFAQTAEFLDEPWPGKVRKDGSPVLVRDLVANLLDAHARDGVDLSLGDAYAQVIQQHPEISKVLRQREEARAVSTAQAATQRARAASSSVQSRPATRPASASKADLDSILNEAFSSSAGR